MTRDKRKHRTVVADSHNLFRRGLATLIAAEADMEVIGEAASAAGALAIVSAASPDGAEIAQADVLILEIGLLRDDPEATRALRMLPERTAVLLLAPSESAECLELTMAAGARGYMLKSTPPAQLIAGIRRSTVLEDRDSRGISPQAPDLQALAQTERSYSRTSPLTSREQEVMTLLAEGRTVREVAAELSLSIKTIEAHKLNLMRKLDIHNRASLVDYAVRSGLIPVQQVAKQ
jgi:DNA-binding NarL/FixJ family response regulator